MHDNKSWHNSWNKSRHHSWNTFFIIWGMMKHFMKQFMQRHKQFQPTHGTHLTQCMKRPPYNSGNNSWTQEKTTLEQLHDPILKQFLESIMLQLLKIMGAHNNSATITIHQTIRGQTWNNIWNNRRLGDERECFPLLRPGHEIVSFRSSAPARAVFNCFVTNKYGLDSLLFVLAALVFPL